MNVQLRLRRDSDSLADALTAGGDERIALDPKGVNKYLCPSTPAPELACLSSCTASPISDRSYDAALQLHRRFGGGNEAGRPAVIAAAARDVRARIAAVFGIADVAEILLCPSGTDAMLTATVLLAAERPEISLTVILPNAAGTGSGVPVAASGRPFSAADEQRPPLMGDDDRDSAPGSGRQSARRG